VKVLLITFLVLLLSGYSIAGVKKEQVTLIENGKLTFEITYAEKDADIGECVYKSDYPKSSKELAELISQYFLESSGSKPKTTKAANIETDRIILHIGSTQYVKVLKLDMTEYDEGEFSILFPDEKNIVIAGKYQHGIEWGAYEFLERFLGVKWLFAGELGKHVPQHKNLKVDCMEVREKPAYLSRTLSFNNKRKELKEWTRNSRLRRRIKFHHNLGVLFNPRVYLKKHPEFYPIHNGARLKPTSLIGWQPCFSAKGIVDFAVTKISQHFNKYPETKTYSLGINDNSGFCECEECRKKDGSKKNYCDRDDRSNSYYEFCNEVVEEIIKKYPDKKFGLLAYEGVAAPPDSGKLHSALVPFTTYDRMKWVDKNIREKGHKVTSLWEKNTVDVGWYDYIYGSYYSVPRVYFNQMAEYLRYGTKNSVSHYYGEAYISDNYKEGPKFYLTMKLLWNPDLNVDKALTEWYQAFAGPKAAPYVKKYFAYWERFWTRRIPKGKWFKKNGDITYLMYKDISYFSELNESDFTAGEKLLKKALLVTAKGKQTDRVKMLLEGICEAKEIVISKNNYDSLNKKKNVAKLVREIDAFPFDQNYKGWGTWKNSYSYAIFTHDKKEGHNGIGSIHINKDGDMKAASVGSAVYIRHTPVELKKLYRISVYIKTEDTNQEADISVVTRWREKDARTWVNFMTMTRTTPLKNIQAGKWQKVEMLVKVPDKKNIKYLVTLLTAGSRMSKGKVWFDDFKVEEVLLEK
jgi:hypothetical protein